VSPLVDWPRLGDQARRVLVDQLLERLPPWLELAELTTGLPRFTDARSGETWRLFTGGPITLGATPERIAAVEAFQSLEPLTLFDPTVHWPVREVAVSPFLLMEKVISVEDEPRYFFQNVMKEQAELLGERGQRLPTEAEWEFAWWALEGGQHEHWEPGSSELCADGWRPHLLELAAVDPLIPGGPEVVRMASFDPHKLESVFPPRLPLSLVRLVTIRPALDLPALDAT
jgi:hypothetical protein